VIRAVIDLGTNTFNLAIAKVSDQNLELIHTEKEAVGLGMGGINAGFITEEAIQRALSCLSRFVSVSMDLGVFEIKAIGTSAIRDAQNSNDFLNRVFLATGISIEVIDGPMEATYIYKGIAFSYAFETPGLIMDIGGGSTEFILANLSGIQKLVSLDIGVSRIIQSYSLQDPLSKKDIENIEKFLEERDQDFFSNIEVESLIGASGSFETFYELIHENKFPSPYEPFEVNLNDFLEVLDQVIASSLKERNENPFIIEIRKKMAPIAAVKVRWVLSKINPKRIVISPCSLKEGVLLSF
jgi:exopolyphosphatase/guanosine-5'-triphosphate,3'-diphosphate pyrophosphatase